MNSKQNNNLDLDGDGIVSAEENAQAVSSFKKEKGETYGTATGKRARRLKKRLKNADKNKDGDKTLNVKEFRTAVEKVRKGNKKD